MNGTSNHDAAADTAAADTAAADATADATAADDAAPPPTPPPPSGAAAAEEEEPELPPSAPGDSFRGFLEGCEVDVAKTMVSLNGSAAPEGKEESLETFLSRRSIKKVHDLQILTVAETDGLLASLTNSPRARERIDELTTTKAVPADAPNIISYV